ncbi:hypothetical protein [Atlantibacter sp. RC6]|uniref:hypothetical protein n=1 Tax=Atlantibacter sp. RC6 TaxID=2587036 RepID=UPI00160638DF|nr:hypothetical protein [Atlantibacter sp. RC6]MBB3320650.1 phage terminase Nu1 subunit (DNA packaging protein) [Atlantibacter sp. RC6]
MEQNFITASEIARRYGFSIQGVQKWRERGIPYDTNKKKYPEKDSTDWIVKNILDPLKDLDTSEKLKLAKLKKAEAEARIAEMDERSQAGSLIPVALVQAALSKYCSQVRTSMTQISTTQARFLLEQATDTRSLKEALQRVIVERLNEIGAVMESDSFFYDPVLTDISEDNGTTYPVESVPVIAEPDIVDDDEPDFFEENE